LTYVAEFLSEMSEVQLEANVLVTGLRHIETVLFFFEKGPAADVTDAPQP
jgi:hypothetical protein